MMFRDREAAGRELAKRLAPYATADTVVLGIPRGGVAVARPVADLLGLPFDVIVVRKIGHPTDPEYAIGATDAAGTLLYDEHAHAAVDPSWLAAETGRQQQEATRRECAYRGDTPPLDLSGKTAIIVDDGIATGLSMRLAAAAARARDAARIIAAAPVAALKACAALAGEADTVVTVVPPDAFLGAVGSHYESFPQLEDETVRTFLSP